MMVLALIFFISVFIYSIICILLSAFLGKRIKIYKRLEEIPLLGGAVEEYRKKKNEKKRKIKFLHVSENFSENIKLSGIKFRPEEFAVIWIFLFLVPAVLCFTFTTDLIRTMIFALAGAFLPPLYIKKEVKKKRELFRIQLGDALMILSNGIRAGLSFSQALDSVSKAMPDPIGGEFRTASMEIQLGISVEESLLSIADKMNCDDLRLLTTAVVVQQRVGGNLSEIMDTIAGTIRDRFKIQRNVRTLTAQGRASGIMIGSLPILILVAVSFINPEYMNPMYNTLKGKLLLFLSVIMEITGFLIIRKIVDIKL